MTIARRDGGGTPFGQWIRGNPRLDSRDVSISVTDIDYIVHRFKMPIDKVGTRELQCMLNVEVKTFGVEPSDSQRDTLFKQHQVLHDKRLHLRSVFGAKVRVWHWGCTFLKLAGPYPRNGEQIHWGVFDSLGKIRWHLIDWVADLEEILSFERDPHSPNSRISFRRHHKTRMLELEEDSPLGFKVSRILMVRS